MSGIGILGAGEVSATLARRLAESGRFASVYLVDEDVGRAKGKALDLAQSGPVEGYDTRLHGLARIEDLPPLAALVVAEPGSLPRSGPGTGPPETFVKSVVRAAGAGLILDVSADGAALVAAAVRLGFPRARVLGSFPLAVAGALRVRLAEELAVAASSVSLTLIGLPPERSLLPRGSCTIGGVPIDRLSPLAERRALEAVRGRIPGPVALATAADRVLRAALQSAPTVLPVFAALQGEYGHRGAVLAVPARLARGGVAGVVELPLDPGDRAAFDTLADRSRAGGW
jgi:malate dehydrogenase